MKQILQNLKDGSTEIAEVPCPQVGRGDLLIRTTRTLISAGTERMPVDFGKAGLIDKARQQPDKVRQVLEKVKTDGLAPTLAAVRLGYCQVGVVAAVGGSRQPAEASEQVPSFPLSPGPSPARGEGGKPHHLTHPTAAFALGDRVVSNGKHAEIDRDLTWQ